MSTLAITGVTGFVGQRLAEWALSNGHRVRGFSRRPWGLSPPVPASERRLLIFPDRPDPSDLTGCDAVIHLALSDRGLDPAVADRVDRAAAEHLYAAAVAAGCERFVFVSTQSAHAGALNNYGRTKFGIESMLTDRPGVVIVRPGLIWDYEDGGLLGMAGRAAALTRVFPLLGGRAAVAQTVHLDDLCVVLGDLAVGSWRDIGGIIEVARPEVEWLGDLITAKALARHRHRVKVVPVGGAGLRTVAAGGRLVGVGDALADVLQGIEGHRVMDTAEVLKRHGWSLRPSAFDGATERWAAAPDPATGSSTAPVAALGADTPVAVVAIGAGRMGLLHSLIARQRADVTPLGLVDPAVPAHVQARLMLGLGISTFRTLDKAKQRLGEHQRLGAVVATPPRTHRAIVAAVGPEVDALLVEKPLGADPSETAAVAGEIDSVGVPAIVGYQLAAARHVVDAAAALASGALGSPQSIDALTLVEKITADTITDYWEWSAAAGGGAIGGVGSHLLSIIWRLFGEIEIVSCHRDEHELRATIEGSAQGVPFALRVAVDAGGFAVPETRVVVHTDRGALTVTPGFSTFRPSGSVPVWVSSPQVGFDPAPLEGGASYVEEVARLVRSAVPGAGRVDDSREAAASVEAAVGEARSVARVVLAPGKAVAPHPARTAEGSIGLDLRRSPSTIEPRCDASARLILGEAELDRLDRLGAERCLVVLPDLPAIFRALGSGGPVGLVRHFRLGHLAAAVSTTSPVAALSPMGGLGALVGIGVRTVSRSLPSDFGGTVVLDGYVVDYLAAVGASAEAVPVLTWLRRRLPRARVGVEVRCGGLFGRTADVVAPLIDTLLLSGPSSTHPEWVPGWARDHGVEVVRTLGGLSQDVHEIELAAQAQVGSAPDVEAYGQVAADWRWCGDTYRERVASEVAELRVVDGSGSRG